MVPFSGFSPDLDPTTPGIITACSNLIPTLRGYSGGPSGVDTGMAALASAALNSALVVTLSGATRLFAGTSTKLYEKNGLVWTDISRLAAYNASTSYPWRFAQYRDTTLAVNKGDVIQASTTGVFVDLSAPKAGVMCVASGFVIIGNTNEVTYGDSVDRWWCSALLDYTNWVPDISTQCTTGRLVDSPGPITGMKPLGYDVVAYKEQSMYLGRYSGPPGAWNFTLLPGTAGCSSQEAIVDVGTSHIFIGQNDIYTFDGSLPRPIGAPLREWFFADLDLTYRYLIKGGHDRVNALVYFHYPRVGSGGALNGCIVYNYKTDKWGVAHRSITTTVQYILGGYTWDTLPVIGLTWNDWPAVAYDSPYWTASSRYTAYFDTDNKIYSLTGASVTASLTTGDYGSENQYSLLSRITLRYLVAPASAIAVNSYQDVHGGMWTLENPVSESNGRFDLFRSAPWHRATFTFTGNVEVTGIDANIKPDGAL